MAANRKTYQRKLNKLVRNMNINIKEDELWKGRFEFRQKGCQWYEFPDKSGAMMYVTIRGYDKETGNYHDYRLEYAPWLSFCQYHLWELANDFIVKDLDVWKVEKRPTAENSIDYTNKRMPDSIMKNDFKFY